jgi:hypothetical protein
MPIQCLTSSEILTPTPSPPGECVPPPPLVRGQDILTGWRGGGGSIVRKTPDTALYSFYVSTLRGSLSSASTHIQNIPIIGHGKGWRGMEGAGRDQRDAWAHQRTELWSRIQRKTWCLGPYAGADYNLNLCPLQSWIQHFTMGDPMSESTIILRQSRLYPLDRDLGFGLCMLCGI